MAKTWSSHGPSNWFFLNQNQCSKGWSMPNFTILGVSYGPPSLEMAKTWPFHGRNMVLTLCFKLVLNPCAQGWSKQKFHISECIL